ncbi:MAG: NADH-quinone oxidoreductase subunit N [Vicinamibacteria bacterium]
MPSLGTLASLKYFLPELTLVLTLLVVVAIDIALQGREDRRLGVILIALAGLVMAGVFTLMLTEAPQGGLFSRMLVLDQFGLLLRFLFILTAILVLLLSVPSRELAAVNQGEFFALLLGVTVSMMWMANSVNLLMIYLALEMVSVGSYIMVGYLKTERLSNEASLKYILFGAVSTGTMLYGLSLLFGLTGTLDLYGIRSALMNETTLAQAGPALLFSVILVLAGIGFKTATVPFHFWCPDVYTGAPTPVTAFLSVGPKVAGFAVLVRFFFGGMGQPVGDGSWQIVGSVNWQALLIGVSVATMTLGNVAALLQTNLKRLLAYSSIAHAGYILMGAVVLSDEGLQAMLAYMVIYLFMNLGAFLVVMVVYDRVGSFDVKDYGGIWKRSPTLTIAMGIFLLSLMGIPPFAGFLAKFYVFAAVIRAGLAWFAVIGVLNSAVGVFYYMKVLKAMVIEEGTTDDTSSFVLHPMYAVLLVVMLVPNVIGLVLWGYLDRITEYSMKILETL